MYLSSFSLRRAAFVLAALACGAAGARAQVTTAVYVDAAGGDDARDGLTPGTAWKSLAKVNAQTFGPGARLRFKAGERWAGRLRPLGSGSEGVPIVIERYGDGARPAIDGDGGAASAAVMLFNQSWWTIQDLEVTNYQASASPHPTDADSTRFAKRGIYVRAHDVGRVRGITVRNTEVHRVNSPLDDDTNSNSRYYGGIYFEVTGSTTPTYFDGVLVENNHVHDLDRTGISTNSSWDDRNLTSRTGEILETGTPDNWTPSLNFVMRGNLIERIGGNGAIIRTARAPLIEGNRVLYAGRYISGNGMFCFNTDAALFQFNEVAYTVFNAAGQTPLNARNDTDAGGIDSDFRTKRTVIQFNYLHHNGDGAVVATGGENRAGQAASLTRFNDSTVVRYNVMERNNRVGIHLSGRLTNLVFHNNTVYTDASNANVNLVDYTAWGSGADAWPRGDRYYNNVFVHGGTSPDYVLGSARNVDFERNLYAGALSATEPASDSSEVRGDPRFADVSGGPDGFKVLAGSPAIGAGTRPASFAAFGGARRDYYGNAIPASGPVDLGAHQFSGPVANEAEPNVAGAPLSLAPNPARGRAVAWFHATRAGTATVAVYDALGRRVAFEERAVRPGGDEAVALDLSGLASGVYVVRVSGAGARAETRALVVSGGGR